MNADERPETYRAAAALMRERPGPWEVAYDPPDGDPSDPSTKLCLVSAIQEACRAETPGGYGNGVSDASSRAFTVFGEATGKSPYGFYRYRGADSAALALDAIAARLEADRA